MMDKSRMPAIAMFSVRGMGCGGECQKVDFGSQLLQALFLLHSEALFLVDDDQPELLEADVFLNQAVGANHDIHSAVGKITQNLAGLLAGAETG